MMLDSDFGKLEVKTVSIADGSRELSGLLYRPKSASATNPSPAIVLAHGIGGSKEMMSCIGLELARRGFVALCLDLLGHGDSGGTVGEGTNEPSFGVLSAVQYLKSQSFVNASAIGLVGHSLGAGAVRATFSEDCGIGASVLIAGGLGTVSEGPAYGLLNSTFPKNLLVIVGKYDVLFNLTQLATEELLPAFGTQQRVVPGFVYGSFSSQTARKLVTPATTHLFEPFDPVVVSETVAWMENAFKSSEVLAEPTGANLIYIEREAAILTSLAAFFGAALLAFFPLSRVVKPRQEKEVANQEHGVLRDWKIFGIWGMLGLALFLPMFFVGFAISFPPLIFGASIAWWMLSVGLAGLLVLFGFLPKFSKVKIKLNAAIVKAFDRKHLVIALVLFILMFAVVNLLQALFNFNLRIVSPIFRGLTSARRTFAFFSFLPFFLVYFLVEGLYLHELRGWPLQKQGLLSELLSGSKVVLGKVAPLVAVICLQYVPMVLFNVRIFPSYAGFLVEFLWLIIPIFIITTTCSWWLYRNTKSVWSGAAFNALMMAWAASTVFPF
jgi:dienelactone hydrolase